ncbi:phage baseplate assembly protein V [Nostoc sp. 'Peltigera membranacea cyanobiont' 232]|uniref:phage baseplate assembly protein V n=1 Tax=Nostoc sp. 'Peltigera membranacea cyanobiont' 232 TaxID=2014531 RepID=UPI000B95C8A5|nr:phage baseplate assembly protein V [Nostoc sp. 'Peltigera membranacea cyanobiont' 232]OYE02922.1 hypothetical protein CDG79_21285 [Nostoc sp. 'Peltigera membranacea cyanobiont' 232]
MSQQQFSPNEISNQQRSPFYGKYRGVVWDNNDSWKIGRVRAKVQEIWGDKPGGWALPCVPYAGQGVGLFLMPPKGALVWIEFENGDTSKPIWSGCFWADKQVDILPANPANPNIKVLKTDIGKIEINDKAGEQSITIEAKFEKQTMRLVMNISGIEISNANDKTIATIKLNGNNVSINNGNGATIKLNGNNVSINNDGLEVT